MKKFAMIALLAFASPVLASDAELALGTVLGTTIEDVTAALTSMGYETRKAEVEDGKIEAYIVKDGKMGEIYVSPETGAVTKIEMK